MSCGLCCSLREDQVTIVALHPGWVETDLGTSNGQLKPPLNTHTSVASLASSLRTAGDLWVLQTGKIYPTDTGTSFDRQTLLHLGSLQNPVDYCVDH